MRNISVTIQARAQGTALRLGEALPDARGGSYVGLVWRILPSSCRSDTLRVPPGKETSFFGLLEKSRLETQGWSKRLARIVSDVTGDAGDGEDVAGDRGNSDTRARP